MSSAVKYFLVTGTNSGLGLGICNRLIDDFLKTQPQEASLNVLFTTRSARKGDDTLTTLEVHLAKHHPPHARKRISLRPEIVELTNLLSVKALAQKLVASGIPKLDAIILNAGLAGWSGVNWPMTLGTILLDIRTNTTWPRFKMGIAGLLTPDQFPVKVNNQTEPLLGQIFCANVFGHYMLVHWLMPLLQACPSEEPGKIVWVSSIEPQKRHFDEDDFQALRSKAAYEHSKRLIDIIGLNYDRPSTAAAITGFTDPHSSISSASDRPALSTPTMHVVHPGILATSIIALYWIMQQGYYLGVLLARLVGSPWATVEAYTAAASITWIALTSSAEIESTEAQCSSSGNTKSGRVKWGTAVTRLGTPSAKPCEVELWGLNGSGEPYEDQWWGGKLGRAPGATEATREDVEEFVAQGARVWRKMEELRTEWEARIEQYEAQRQES